MNGAHLHLVVNHLPIVGVIIGTLVLLTGFVLRKKQVKETALGIFIFASITAIVAFLTGEEAEETVEHVSGISETLIHIHEEFAETFLILSIILGVISLITLFLSIKNIKYAKFGFVFSLLLALALVFVGKLVGTSGGEIRHSEIRSTNVITSEPNENIDHDED